MRDIGGVRDDVLLLRSVVENAPMVLWAIDGEGIFTVSEGRALADIGLRPGQVLGTSAFELYRDNPNIIVALRKALAGEEFTNELESAGRVFETRYCPLRDATGKVTGVLGVSIDITERRHAEAERAKFQAQLLQVQKLESLGVLAGGIAHDFNNILTAVLGGASTALLTLPEESPARRDIETVVLAARRAGDLARQMLAYSGKGHFEVRPIDLSAHIREIATLLETTLAKKVQLRLELAPDLPAIEADVTQVQQVIMNLVINGAEAIGDQRGTVLVTTGVFELDEAYRKTLFEPEKLTAGRYVYIEVHDTGCGMDSETISKIFDPFFTTKFTGRGLGLAAVLGIVRAHKGAIRVYSNPGKGSTVKVFFPASASAPSPARAPVTQFRGEGLVLVIDDDPGVRATAQRMLQIFGFSVIEAVDGRHGVEVFTRHASEIVLVLLDMTMPEMNGEETFRELRRLRPDVPVILASGYNEIEATRRFTAKGLAGFLQKPFTPTEMAARLAAVLGLSGPQT
jgi:PAS domain S-box-containing protein